MGRRLWSQGGCFLERCGATWAIKGSILGPLDSEGGSPQIFFLGVMLENNEKGIQKRALEKHQVLIKRWYQHERIWEVTASISLYTRCKTAVVEES